MKENTMATNFEPLESVIFRSIQELGTHENKAIHSILIIVNHSTTKKLHYLTLLCL